MSVRTTADEKKDEALEHLHEAYKCLLEVLDPETYGSGDFNDEYIHAIEEAIPALLKIKRILK